MAWLFSPPAPRGPPRGLGGGGSRSPGSNRCPRRSGCKLPGSGFPYGVGERTSVEDGNVCATEHPLRRKRAAAPSTQALLPRPDRWFGPVRECRFRPLQIGVDVVHRCRALNVFCLRDLTYDLPAPLVPAIWMIISVIPFDQIASLLRRCLMGIFTYMIMPS